MQIIAWVYETVVVREDNMNAVHWNYVGGGGLHIR